MVLNNTVIADNGALLPITALFYQYTILTGFCITHFSCVGDDGMRVSGTMFSSGDSDPGAQEPLSLP